MASARHVPSLEWRRLPDRRTHPTTLQRALRRQDLRPSGRYLAGGLCHRCPSAYYGLSLNAEDDQ